MMSLALVPVRVSLPDPATTTLPVKGQPGCAIDDGTVGGGGGGGGAAGGPAVQETVAYFCVSMPGSKTPLLSLSR